MRHAAYRKHNDGSHNSSTYHKKDGTPMRAILQREASDEIDEFLDESTQPESELDIVVHCEPISVRQVTVNITRRN